GLSNTLASAVAYAALLAAGTEPLVAASLAFVVGSVNGFAWNRRWTFRHAASASLSRYLLVQAAGLAATDLLVAALVEGTGRVAAYVAATIAVTAATFLVNRNWTFTG